MKDQFEHVRTWVFDLDNTLYPRSAGIFDQMDGLMNAWIMREIGVDEATAQTMREEYLERYGTTLGGLMTHHDIDPDPFLHETHELDLGRLEPAPALRAQIEKLPGRRIVFTNGSRRHADRVTEALGLANLFDAHYAIEDAGYVSKPARTAFDRVFAMEGLMPERAAMFEDMAENLLVPHGLGMRTVLVTPTPDRLDPVEHIHHVTDDLTHFLSRITA